MSSPEVFFTNNDVEVFHYSSLTSTQDNAQSILNAGHKTPFWVLADKQEKARGRLGRKWQSDHGNFAATLVVDAPKSMRLWPHASFVAAIGLHRALISFGVEGLSLKWPNDVLLDGKKIAGILIEPFENALRIGFGVNLVDIPMVDNQDGSIPAATLSEFNLYPEKLLNKLDTCLHDLLEKFNDGSVACIHEQFSELMQKRQCVRVDDGFERREVTVIGLDKDGALLAIDLAGQKRRFLAADVVPIQS